MSTPSCWLFFPLDPFFPRLHHRIPVEFSRDTALTMASPMESEKIQTASSEKYQTPSPPSLSPSPILVPSKTDLLIASVYPLALVAGSVFSLFSPSEASTTSYFSQKHNIFNTLFVKYGWLWTTLVFMIHLSRLRSSSKPKALLRYGLATFWWVAITQWFFGPPIMDRTFLITGGTCHLVANDPARAREEMDMSHARLFATSAACKVAGGDWRGGHDLSGHVFLLTHASLFLWSEVLPVLNFEGVGGWESMGVLGLLALWFWMLLMTGIYFHTWREKVGFPSLFELWRKENLLTIAKQLTGCVVASIQWVVLYVWALRTHPTVRSAVGVPGI
jgi:Inositol phospholipid synthesis and fat-storage-inducing TM